MSRAKSISGLPVLMKDFVIAEGQLDFAVSLGADAVLLIVRALPEEELAALRRGAGERGLSAVVEAHDAEEIRAPRRSAPTCSESTRATSSTFATDRERSPRWRRGSRTGPCRMAESGIRSREDVVALAPPGIEAFLVGETLLRAEDPEEELRGLRG